MTDDIRQTLKSHGEQLELIASAVFEHSEKLRKLDVIEEKIDKLPSAQKLDDTLVKIDLLLKKAMDIEQEGTMRTNALRRIEEKADQNANNIQRIMPLVGISS